MRSRVMSALTVLLACALLASAQQLALFLSDGTRMAVREFEILDDRVRYFSADRGQWEEVPLDIVDMERTNAENRRAQAVVEQREAEVRRERVAERRARTELHSVPLDDGIYYLDDRNPVPVEQAFWELGRSKARGVVNVLAPVTMMPGRRTFWIKGLAAQTVTSGEKPIFYMRLDSFSQFGIVRVEPQKDRERRVVMRTYIVPKAEEQFEKYEDVEVFRQQLAPLVYKVWPVEPLPVGEYAVVEFTPGESDLRVWDFSHQSTPTP